MNQPTLHKPFSVNTRIKLPHYFSSDKDTPLFGTVVGIASMHVIFNYIVLLDKPIQTNYGPELKSEDGKTNWRLDS